MLPSARVSAARPTRTPVGLSEAHTAAMRDRVSSALEAFRELGSDPDPTAAAGFYSESPTFRIYENGALRVTGQGRLPLQQAS